MSTIENNKIKVCNSFDEFNELLSKARPSNAVVIAGMYNSLIDRILIGDATNQGLYTIPIDDHAIVRGHAVFDTATIVKGCLYRHRVHVDRFFESAEKSGLNLSFLIKDNIHMNNTIDTQKEKLVDIMKELARATNTDNGMIRMWLTAGPGNFGTTKDGCITSLYMVIYKGNPFWRTGIKPNDFDPQPLDTLRGVKEVTVSKKYPMKNSFLATTKSSNYLINTLGASEAKLKGGHYGIWVDPITDEVYESSVRNVIFILKDRTMVTPPYIDGKILKGCTVRRIVELAEKHVLGDSENSLIRKIQTDKVVLKKDLIRVGISEMMLTSGDTGFDAVTQWDENKFGEGDTEKGEAKPGPVFLKLVKLLFDEAMSGTTSHHEKIYYN